MTLVHVDLRTPDDGPAAGVLEWIPTRRRTVDTHIVLPDAIQVPLTGGVADVEVDATGPDWAWRVVERARRGTTRYVVVPDVAEAEYSELVDVDPATLDPAAEPEAAWGLALDAMGQRVDDAEADVAAVQDGVAVLDGRVAELEAQPKTYVLGVDDPAPEGVAYPAIIYRPDPEAAFEAVGGSATTFAATSSDTISLPVPAGTQVGDTLVAVVTWQTTSSSVSAPSGWVVRQLPHSNSDYRSTTIFTYKVTSVPGANQVFTLAGGGRAVGVMFRTVGVDADDPLLVATGEASRATSTVTVPATPGSAGGLMVSVTNGQATAGQNPFPLTYSNGQVPFIGIQSSADTGITRTFLGVAWWVAGADVPQHTVSTPGAIGSFAVTQIALRPAA
jgi:hypothetical protein